MTNKAQTILQKLKLRTPHQNNNPEQASDPGSTAGDDRKAVLNESNDLGQRQEQMIREAVPKMTVY